MYELEPAPEPTGSKASTLVEDVWELHGAALYALARVILNDAHDAERVVAQAILDACKPDHAAVDVDRRTLARYVLVLWARRRAELGGEQDIESTDLSGVAVMSGLSYAERSAVAWGLLGAHTYTEIASFVGLPPREVAELMRSGLLRMRDVDPADRPSVTDSWPDARGGVGWRV